VHGWHARTDTDRYSNTDNYPYANGHTCGDSYTYSRARRNSYANADSFGSLFKSTYRRAD
jgi:hypothetical protein